MFIGYALGMIVKITINFASRIPKPFTTFQMIFPEVHTPAKDSNRHFSANRVSDRLLKLRQVFQGYDTKTGEMYENFGTVNNPYNLIV